MLQTDMLFLSPHLDDVAFSCGGVFHRLRRAGWSCHLHTVFTRSVLDPEGFALACQTDKGLSAKVDYMALRRAEDIQAASELGASSTVHMDLPEAPHRGYESAEALFGGRLSADEGVERVIAERLIDTIERMNPALIFAPQGMGGHVDHRVLVSAVGRAVSGRGVEVVWYQDAPYVWRTPGASACEECPGEVSPERVEVSEEDMDAKVRASRAYVSQLAFQFGEEGVSEPMWRHARQVSGGEGAMESLLGSERAIACLRESLAQGV